MSERGLLGTRHRPYGVGEIIADDQRTAWINRHANWSATCLAIFGTEAGSKINCFTCRLALAERNKDDFVTGRVRSVPAAVLTDEDTVCKLVTHDWRREGDAQCGDLCSQT